MHSKRRRVRLEARENGGPFFPEKGTGRVRERVLDPLLYKS
jgi:hypothetical protein